MASDRKVVIQVVTDEKGAIVGLKSVSKGISDIKVEGQQAQAVVQKLTDKVAGVGKGATVKNLKLTTTEFNSLSNSINQASQASGAAAATTLELGRVISDAPYGIRGMANNVSQVASQIAFMSRSVDTATGKVVGFGGALSAIGKSIMGPLGILLAIQAVIAAVDYFWGGMQKATEEVDNLNSSLDEQISKFNTLSDFFNEDRSSIVDSIFGTTWKDDLKILSNEFNEFGKKIKSLSEEDKDNEELVKKLTVKYKNLLMVRRQITGDAKELRDLEEDDSNEVGRIKALRERLRLNYLIKAELEEQFKVDKKVRVKEKKKDKETFFEGVFSDEDFQERIEGYKERYIQYVEDKRAVEAEIEIAQAELESGGILNQTPRLESEKEILDLKLEEDIARINFMIEARKAEGDAYEDLESEKLLMLTKSQEQQQILDEKISESKTSTLSYVGDAMSAFSKLAGKETAAGKALAIATATIDTYQAANKALNDETIPNTFARIAAVSAVIASGLANVKSILDVKVPNGGGGGNAPSGRTFDFNLVGSTGQNQLAQTIGGQVQQPIKAYVVGSEITNQQQFDSQIQGEATIG